eukprot:CAMPEP_0115154276 /NCGR_PEP_ID=MMETSP0227-20121206/67190_1 /TAXON_ID=89957 /ORGANISM="Polarella glacialis, Strain CCMP 1383" /LENGTH=46 /DNA_ID= /DNA_START= /DNA_END= /DNA_ORIENTATION=
MAPSPGANRRAELRCLRWGLEFPPDEEAAAPDPDPRDPQTSPAQRN